MGFFSSDQSEQPAPVIDACDACILLDNDYTPKLVQYCRICDAWLCAPCAHSPWRRAQAAAKRMFLGR